MDLPKQRNWTKTNPSGPLIMSVHGCIERSKPLKLVLASARRNQFGQLGFKRVRSALCEWSAERISERDGESGGVQILKAYIPNSGMIAHPAPCHDLTKILHPE